MIWVKKNLKKKSTTITYTTKEIIEKKIITTYYTVLMINVGKILAMQPIARY